MQGHSPWLIHDQSHYIEVLQGAIFVKQNMKFGLILGWLAVLKKQLGQLTATLETDFFHVFMSKKIEHLKKNIVEFALKSRIISFTKFFLTFFFDFILQKNRLHIHNLLCIALLETPSFATSI